MQSVVITPEDYMLAWEAPKYWCEEKNSDYGRGCAENAAFMGRLGELGWGYLIGLRPNFERQDKGDDGDFLVEGYKHDVKNAFNKPYHGNGLVYARHECGYSIELKSDLYIFAYTEERDHTYHYAKINYVGWCHVSDIIPLPLCPARMKKMKHMNKEVPYNTLIPVEELIGKSCVEVAITLSRWKIKSGKISETLCTSISN
jgi:hypothetical protein